MTEADAKKKWCPMVRVGSDHAVNRVSDGSFVHQTTCIASDCAMWIHEKTEVVNVVKGVSHGRCGLIR